MSVDIRKKVRKWAAKEETFLRHQFHGKTSRDRFRGLSRSKRNEAKLFLLAMTPVFLIGPFIGKWSDASIAGKAILAATALWMLGILLVGIYFLLRAIVRVSRKPLD